MERFGEILTKYRVDAGLGLREYAKLIDYDPSNLSKIERGVNAPPQNTMTLKKWASKLSLVEGTPSFSKFMAAGRATFIAKGLKTDTELIGLLPAFFRTVDNKQTDPNTYKKLLAILRQNT